MPKYRLSSVSERWRHYDVSLERLCWNVLFRLDLSCSIVCWIIALVSIVVSWKVKHYDVTTMTDTDMKWPLNCLYLRILRISMNFRDLYKTLRNSKILVIVNMEIQHGGWKIFIWSFILRCIHSDWSICFRFSHRSVFSLHFKSAYEIFILCPPTPS